MQGLRNRSTTLIHINRLPSECISQIFTMGSSPRPMDEEDPTSDDPSWNSPVKPFRLIIPAVCRRWRDIALNTPRLWSTIEFSDAAPFGYSELMLKRSRDCPLSIRVDFSRPKSEITTVLHLLRRYTSNRHISLTIVYTSPEEAGIALAGQVSLGRTSRKLRS
ncbi:hypothetical protein BOTBODRAFT_164638 [Botryobasidium botryosum FD-172 SS1]|uniref:Uncharacterized protein n=1 Tax=Botryobasidium botryosum (strain FD-172 SS1) TaxID=930990 RepID=A0A067M1S2_BOTB1|nr:hypothetical protein BOTBODRAFT_164638 [Botryobasidium botryosum FD-172 SS1]